MKPQIYNFETRFDFGKHKGKSLLEVLKARESRYIGYLVFNNVPWFILDPVTLNLLDKDGFFDDLEMSYYGSGGSFPLSSIIGYKKEDIVNQLKKNYEDFIKDPTTYEKIARMNYRDSLKRNEENSRTQEGDYEE